MNKEKIYQLLNEKKANATMIARSLGVTPGAVQKVIIDGYGSERVAHAVAKICGMPMFDMFPYYEKKHKEQQERARIQKQVDATLAKLA